MKRYLGRTIIYNKYHGNSILAKNTNHQFWSWVLINPLSQDQNYAASLIPVRPKDVGINPVVRTTLPFSKYRNFFEVTVVDCRGWMRIGIADMSIWLKYWIPINWKLDGCNYLLGNQAKCCNLGVSEAGTIYFPSQSQINCAAYRKGGSISFFWKENNELEIALDGEKKSMYNTSKQLQNGKYVPNSLFELQEWSNIET